MTTAKQARAWLIREQVKTRAELDDYDDDEVLDMYHALQPE